MVNHPDRITTEWLREIGMCSDWIGMFNSLFPDGLPFTLESFEEMGIANMGLLSNLFRTTLNDFFKNLEPVKHEIHKDTLENRRRYDEAKAEADLLYDKEIAPAKAAFAAADEAAREKSNKLLEPHRATFEEENARIENEYRRKAAKVAAQLLGLS